MKQIDDQLIILPQRQPEGAYELKRQQTDNSLKRSESFPSIPKDQHAEGREAEDKSSQLVDSQDNKMIDTSQIQIDLEGELENQKNLEQNDNASSAASPPQDKSSGKNQDPQQRQEDYNSDLRQLRDQRFFLSKVDDDNENPSAGKNKSNASDGLGRDKEELADKATDASYTKKNPFKPSIASSDDGTKEQSTNLNYSSLTGMEDNDKTMAHLDSSLNREDMMQRGATDASGRSPSTGQKLIKVENQQPFESDPKNRTNASFT